MVYLLLQQVDGNPNPTLSNLHTMVYLVKEKQHFDMRESRLSLSQDTRNRCDKNYNLQSFDLFIIRSRSLGDKKVVGYLYQNQHVETNQILNILE